jgi:hypothetical protein
LHQTQISYQPKDQEVQNEKVWRQNQVSPTAFFSARTAKMQSTLPARRLSHKSKRNRLKIDLTLRSQKLTMP